MEHLLLSCLALWGRCSKLMRKCLMLSLVSAYIFLAIEALADGGVAAGLPRELALGLASQMVQIILSITQPLIRMIG
ncbi:hypothetical protein Bca4012_033483 [Brassica carinata]